jgi:hypothetical protein
MYYIYHIKGVKWGCTINLKRRLKAQNYTINDVCEIIEETDLNKASDLEKELNIKNGYNWRDDQDYRVITKAGKSALLVNYQRHNHSFTKEERALGGYITGKYPTEKSIIARKKNVSKLNVYQTCPYCNIHTRGAAYFRYHGDKCKLKP